MRGRGEQRGVRGRLRGGRGRGEGGKGTCSEGWEYSGPGNSVNSVLMGEG